MPFTPTSTVANLILNANSNADQCATTWQSQIPEGNPDQKREMAMGKILRNEISYITLQYEMNLRDSVYAYNLLKADTSLLSLGTSEDAAYRTFYEACKNSNIGKFSDVKALITDSTAADTAVAIAVNQNIPTTCSPEENEKLVNEIYLKHLNDEIDSTATYLPESIYTPTEMIALQNVAYQNPEPAGLSVYMARAMLRIIVTDDEAHAHTRSCLFISDEPIKDEVRENILYPNPNTGTMYLNYTLGTEDNGYLKLYNVFGEEVKTYTLTNLNQQLILNEKQLESGIYSYTLFINDKIVKSDKIIINK